MYKEKRHTGENADINREDEDISLDNFWNKSTNDHIN